MQKDFKTYLKNRLKGELPGIDAQILMAPKFHDIPFRSFKKRDDAKSSAVLIIISENENHNPTILLTLRSDNLNHHSGQISFPGGRAENLENSIDTALREANEEIGLINNNIEVIGKLTNLYVPPSNSVITPVVAYLINNQEWNINPDEVSELFFIELNKLFIPENKKVEDWELDGKLINVPFWNIHPRVPFWGATAMITSELLSIYKEWLLYQVAF
jgi:8-oxo-dGTP pyrophosphatase MutT (NUDIX family)